VESSLCIIQNRDEWLRFYGRPAIQRVLDRLVKWVGKNGMKFSREKCKVFPHGRQIAQRTSTHWKLTGWRAALKKRTCRT